MKRAVSVLLVLVLCALMLVGCTGENGEPKSVIKVIAELFQDNDEPPAVTHAAFTDAAPDTANAVFAREVNAFLNTQKDAAQVELEKYGLTALSFVGEYSDTVPAGEIISFALPDKEIFGIAEPVIATYSLGKRPANVVPTGTVPALSGLTREQAVSALAAAGFSRYAVGFDYNNAAENTVYKQSVAAGKTVALSSKITFYLSKGARPASGYTVGSTANDFTLPLMNGGSLKLSSLRGKVVLLNFWATWCGPCMEEMPALQQLQNYFGSKLAVVAVSIDGSGDNQTVIDYINGNGFTYRVPRDYYGSKMSQTYPNEYVPQTIIIDKYGIITHTTTGKPDDVFGYYKTVVNAALAR